MHQPFLVAVLAWLVDVRGSEEYDLNVTMCKDYATRDEDVTRA